MTPLLLSSWDRAWRGLRAKGSGHALRDTLLTRYAEPHRRYHGLQHLEECLSTFERVRHLAEHPHEVEMALWFHDAVYDLTASDNESRSASWAKEALLTATSEPDTAERVHALVMATKHTHTPAHGDEQVLVDVDLSILGATPTRFAEYEVQIRQEYAHVPEPIFRSKRSEILKSFLDRDTIYTTPELHQALESQARTNLRAAVEGHGR